MRGVNLDTAALSVLSAEPISIYDLCARLRVYGIFLTRDRAYGAVEFWAELGCATVTRVPYTERRTLIHVAITPEGEAELDRTPFLRQRISDYQRGVLDGLSIFTRKTTYADVWASLIAAPEGLPLRLLGHRVGNPHLSAVVRHMERHGLVERLPGEPAIYRALDPSAGRALLLKEVA